MCIISNVYDDFNKRFPNNPFWEISVQQPEYVWPPTKPNDAEELQQLISELRKYIEEFREAKELAKRLDVLLKQPDCIDPDKAKLEQRVIDLERRLDEVSKVLPAAKK